MGELLSRLVYLIKNGMPKEPYKMVLVVRTDILMTKGKVASQCSHAAVECFSKSSKNIMQKKNVESWMFLGQPKIVLKINSEDSIIKLSDDAKKIGLVTSLIRDAGRTQLEPGTISVLGIGPGPNRLIDKITSHLKLL
ncbi:peptidyl-tRNA hydrolase 2, mitochondrial [Aphidius gifuensis]|uniref:peptidyl-tRNA hydrolase 2, mitochondrial n=1 Tax=Aphidius gifuensis TaxID=684658 RepID=UPI001CDBB678|nr:peptidyl-tRNA hydrolase 2, mitochondrial [Aphidius gifuensis]